MVRKILIVTSTRADWGLLSPVARELVKRSDVELTVMATNMHLDPIRGNTINEIRNDGFDPVIASMPVTYTSTVDAARAMSVGASSAAEILERIKPDVMLLLGDRFEIFAIAGVAAVMRVPIIHISGGEITEGAFDDSFRHAITKLSVLHLTATEAYRRRVIQLGEDPKRVICAGALGVADPKRKPAFSREELESQTGFAFLPGSLLVTLHPETLGDISAHDAVSNVLTALDRFPRNNVLFTYPNNDPDGEIIIQEIEKYAARNIGRVKAVPSLGRERYHSALHYVTAVIGNSSSGVVEVPSAGIPTVNIGNRQLGRIAAESVINCGWSVPEIERAISQALVKDCSRVENPYYRTNTLDIMIRAIVDTPMELFRAPKKFYDLL